MNLLFAAEGPNNPILPVTNEIIWGGIAFFLLLILLSKMAYPAMRKAMDDRAAKIQGDLDAAEQAKADAEQLKGDYDAKIAEAKAEAARIIDEARAEAQRVIEATKLAVEKGVPVVGLEPSSILTFRDEFLALCPGADAQALADVSKTLEEFLVERPALSLKPLEQPIYVHGHCHQKAHDAVSPMLDLLGQIPNADVNMIETSCCGMAGVRICARHN